ncbi:MAG: hypothetical protein DIU60_011555 [Actinomycetes bacterium]|jgi:hypothetical protein|nr:MAG: hypothetical protein DIU60_12000 [Actinomycetota bacterium]
MRRFPFSVDPLWRLPLRLIGVRPSSAYVEVNEEFTVRFGPWLVRTPVGNVADAAVTGPFAPWRVIGPHLSLADRGLTFGTNTRRGVCVRFHEPVRALAPGRVLTHPAVTVTVADPEGLAEHLRRVAAVAR